MIDKIIVHKNEYHDSVTLMTLSNKIKKLEGIHDAVVSMATPMNVELLMSIGLLCAEMESAGPNDLLIAVRADDEVKLEEAFSLVETSLNKSNTDENHEAEVTYHTISQAKKANPDFNVAVISVAGQYAAREARQALKHKMHVMMFSDNVTIDDELELKQMAHKEGLLLMGPDCGTAILNGVGLCFANNVRRGNIGIVAASGTGLQEVTVLIDKLGGGISQAIGVGGRDLSAEIGGIMMLDTLHLLTRDEDTKVIVLVSKPPVEAVANKIMAEIKNCGKPVVICFIGTNRKSEQDGISYANNLEDAAVAAYDYAMGKIPKSKSASIYELPEKKIMEAAKDLREGQQFIRGLFCGGTLAADALHALDAESMEVYSNVAKKREQKIEDPMKSVKHTLIDLGDDVFTLGRPHPMIEPEIRNDRLLIEALDPETAVVLLDFELGFGSHMDPVGVTIDTIEAARQENEKNGRSPVFVAYILGTEKDYQGYKTSRAKLEAEGVLVAESNLHAVQIALDVIKRGRQ